MTPVERLSTTSGPLACAGAPFGADMIAFSRAAEARGTVAIYVVDDDKAAHTALRMAAFVSPRMNLVDLPAWDTLPYDRVSPTAGVAARRCAGLAAIANYKPGSGPMLVITTAASLIQRIPPQTTLQKSSFSVLKGDDINQNELTEYLLYNGYVRAGTVRERGEYAVRGGIIDIFAPTAEHPIRLDFFGTTLETLRFFDPETQRSVGDTKGVSFAPVSEILFDDDVLASFRERYLQAFGPPSGDTMYEAARASIRRQGVESWLPLFHDHLETLFDYVPDDALLGMGHLAEQAALERLAQASDYFAARLEAAEGDAKQGKILKPNALYLTPEELGTILAERPSATFSPHEADTKHF